MGFCCLDFGYPVFGTQTCRTNLDSLELWSISGWFDSVPDGPTLPGWSESWVHRDAVQRDNMNSIFLGQRLWATQVFSHVQRIHWIHQIQGPNLPAGHECLWLSSGRLLLCLDSVQGTRILWKPQAEEALQPNDVAKFDAFVPIPRYPQCLMDGEGCNDSFLDFATRMASG